MTNDFKDFNDCVFVEDVATALGAKLQPVNYK